MRTDPHQFVSRYDTADDERRALAANPAYIALLLPERGRIVYIRRNDREVVARMLKDGWQETDNE